MAQEMCRLCLSKRKLKPIFTDTEKKEKTTVILAMTTGLNIHVNDGLPQQICEECSDFVKKIIKFRNLAHSSEIELLKLGFQHIEPQINEKCKEDTDDYFDNFTVDISEVDNHNYTAFKIEAELDSVTRNVEEHFEPTEQIVGSEKKKKIELTEQIVESEKVQPKIRNKEEITRQLYLNLVEGEFVANGPVKCKICKKTLKKWKYFVGHAKKHLGSETAVDSDIIRHHDDKIEEGTEQLVTESLFAESNQVKKKSKKEMRQLYLSFVEGEFIPNGPVKCKLCKKTFSKWNSFINHARKHLGFKFVCEFCGKSFVSSNQLKRHCRSFHGMARDLKCEHCSYLALDTAQLKVHERRVHTGERPFVCDLCAAAYFSRKCLLQHIESHRTTASVQCDKCPASFKSRRHLAKHVYGTHGDKRRERRRERRQACKTLRSSATATPSQIEPDAKCDESGRYGTLSDRRRESWQAGGGDAAA